MKGKFYPDQVVSEHCEDGVHRQNWRGVVSAMLVQEEVEFLNSLLDCLYGREDASEQLLEDIEKLQDLICGILRTGETRVQLLHFTLGAYDMEDDGSVRKSESERIKWAKRGLTKEPSLELVKSKKKEKKEEDR